MSYERKLRIMAAVSLLLILVYFSPGIVSLFYERGDGEKKLVDDTLLEERHLQRIDISVSHTSLRRFEGDWYLEAEDRTGRLPAREREVEGLIDAVRELRGYVPLDGELEWERYSEEFEATLSIAGERGGGETYSRLLRIGDAVPGSERRYLMEENGRIVEADDISRYLTAGQDRWANLSLFPEGWDEDEILSVEIEGRNIGLVRFRRNGEGAGEAILSLEEERSRSLLRRLLRLEATRFLSAEGSSGFSERFSGPSDEEVQLFLRMRLEDDSGRTARLRIYNDDKGYRCLVEKGLFFLPKERLAGILPLLSAVE